MSAAGAGSRDGLHGKRLATLAQRHQILHCMICLCWFGIGEMSRWPRRLRGPDDSGRMTAIVLCYGRGMTHGMVMVYLICLLLTAAWLLV